MQNNILTFCVEVGAHKERENMGIGVTVADNNCRDQAIWMMKEISTGLVIMDYALALKLALSKAKERHWEDIKITTY